jgi:NADPH-dependent 2,4-dienoyl-CoA reductase/sulfur reductase-like enzyme
MKKPRASSGCTASRNPTSAQSGISRVLQERSLTAYSPSMGPSTAPTPLHTETDVLVIGAGGAGMYAAIEAARQGCRVMLVDRSLIGRGGADAEQLKSAVCRCR